MPVVMTDLYITPELESCTLPCINMIIVGDYSIFQNLKPSRVLNDELANYLRCTKGTS